MYESASDISIFYRVIIELSPLNSIKSDKYKTEGIY